MNWTESKKKIPEVNEDDLMISRNWKHYRKSWIMWWMRVGKSYSNLQWAKINEKVQKKISVKKYLKSASFISGRAKNFAKTSSYIENRQQRSFKAKIFHFLEYTVIPSVANVKIGRSFPQNLLKEIVYFIKNIRLSKSV